MSAAGRLWARAPLWRAVVVLAATASLLALVYPPVSRPEPVVAATGHYTQLPPQLDPFPVQPRESGVFTLGTLRIPLPSGDWHAMRTFHSNGRTPEARGILLLSFAGKRLTGAVLLFGTPSAAPAQGDPAPTLNCTQSDHYVSRDTSAGDRSRQDCWFLKPDSPARSWAAGGPPNHEPSGTLAAAAASLHEQDVAIPPVMLLTSYFVAEGTRWLQVTYYIVPTIIDEAPRLPDWVAGKAQTDPAKAAYIARADHWAEQWATLVRRGFAGQLTQADIPADLATGP